MSLCTEKVCVPIGPSRKWPGNRAIAATTLEMDVLASSYRFFLLGGALTPRFHYSTSPACDTSTPCT